ncbi:MAG: sugar ABC transporter permease [Anaerocolumna sp.]
MNRKKSKLKSLQIFMLFGFVPIIVFFIVVVIPFLTGLFLSFTNWNGSIGKEIGFIGLNNYFIAITDSGFWTSLGKTFYYVIFVVIFTNILAFTFSLLVTSGIKGQNFYRAGYFTPNLIGGVILGYIWQFIFSRVLTYWGGSIGMDIFSKSWLTNPNMAIWALILVGVWQNAGYMMLIYIAGLVGIDKNLIEASKIDGANSLQSLLHIKLPMIIQSFTITLFLTLRKAFMVYDVNLSLTKGGPYGSTELISMHVYNEAFLNQNLGPGQAKAFLLFAIVAAIALVQVFALKKKEVEAL